MAYHLGLALAMGSFSLTINLGMAGVFNPNLSIGDVAMVECNISADYGIDYNENFESLFILLPDRADRLCVYQRKVTLLIFEKLRFEAKR